MPKPNDQKPKVLSHQPVKFETHISSGNGGGNCGNGGWGNGGWGGCFIAITCQEAGEPDYKKLKAVKWLRDDVLMATEEGQKMVERLYEITPDITRKINQERDAEAIYKKLYDDLVLKSIEFIKQGKMEEAKSNYFEVIGRLEQKYLTPSESTRHDFRISPSLSM